MHTFSYHIMIDVSFHSFSFFESAQLDWPSLLLQYIILIYIFLGGNIIVGRCGPMTCVYIKEKRTTTYHRMLTPNGHSSNVITIININYKRQSKYVMNDTSLERSRLRRQLGTLR